MLKELFKYCDDGFINIWSGTTRLSSWYKTTDLESAEQFAIELSNRGEDAYFSLCPQMEIPLGGKARAFSMCRVYGVR